MVVEEAIVDTRGGQAAASLEPAFLAGVIPRGKPAPRRSGSAFGRAPSALAPTMPRLSRNQTPEPLEVEDFVAGVLVERWGAGFA